MSLDPDSTSIFYLRNKKIIIDSNVDDLAIISTINNSNTNNNHNAANDDDGDDDADSTSTDIDNVDHPFTLLVLLPTMLLPVILSMLPLFGWFIAMKKDQQCTQSHSELLLYLFVSALSICISGCMFLATLFASCYGFDKTVIRRLQLIVILLSVAFQFFWIITGTYWLCALDEHSCRERATFQTTLVVVAIQWGIFIFCAVFVLFGPFSAAFWVAVRDFQSSDIETLPFIQFPTTSHHRGSYNTDDDNSIRPIPLSTL